MDRRSFLQCGLIGGGLAGTTILSNRCRPYALIANNDTLHSSTVPLGPVHSITPVVGDGHWIWKDPPEETGYLEPREYELEVGIHLKGKGPAQMIQATTPVPVELPEQTIETLNVEATGCRAGVRKVSAEAAQLVLDAPSIVKGQTISAISKMRLTLFKQYHGFNKEQFPSTQPTFPNDFKRQYLFDSPGIQVRAGSVKKLQRELTGGASHPWDAAYSIYDWVWNNIQGRIGVYTSVVRALQTRVGDCEERAACFVALCRASGIPARLVWIPNHNWAEFYLVDSEGKGHWIPAHTAAYSWFGWTGAHELVIQKGDNLYVPEKKQPQRLLGDWSQWKGAKPETEFTARLTPIAKSFGQDAGPGARTKDKLGRWELEGSHRLDSVLRK